MMADKEKKKVAGREARVKETRIIKVNKAGATATKSGVVHKAPVRARVVKAATRDKAVEQTRVQTKARPIAAARAQHQKEQLKAEENNYYYFISPFEKIFLPERSFQFNANPILKT